MSEIIYRPEPSVPRLPNPLPAVSAFSFTFPPAQQDPYSPSSPAFIDGLTGLTLPRSAIRTIALSLAHGLRRALPSLVRGWNGKLTRGSTVLLFAPNALAYPLALYGCVAAGLRVSCANPAYTAQELLHQLQNCRAEAVFAHPALVPQAVQVLQMAGHSEAEARARCFVLDYKGLSGEPSPAGHVTLDVLLETGALAEEERFDGADAHETAVLCYSSGTTGKAKGVMTSHSNLISNMLMITGHCGDFVKHGRTVAIGVLPFYHIYGLNNLLFHAAHVGVPIVVLPRFDPSTFLSTIERFKVTLALVVPPILLVLLHHPETAKRDLRSLDTMLSGAAPLGAQLVAAFRAKLLAQGADVIVTQGYGLTETSPTMSVVPRRRALEKIGSAGSLVGGLEVRLVDEDGADAPRGGPGEIWVRGPSIMKGYNANEAATKDSITEEGWFKTGDVARIDDEGFIFIVDRRKELIKYKGFQVPPAELEALLLEHPDIADAAVIGIDAIEQATELPRAYVVPANPNALDSDTKKAKFSADVQAWVAGRVASHKRLRGGCVLIGAIPKSPAGKILRRELRELAKREKAEAGNLKAKL